MAFLRHPSRHVLATVANYIESGMQTLGWTDAATTPFGAPAVTFRTTPALTNGSLDSSVTAGVVAVTLGNEVNPNMEEMGGALASQDYPIFIDLFMDTDGTTTALADDVRNHLLGRFDFSKRSLDVVDQVTGTVVPGWKIMLDDVEKIRPDHSYSLFWQVVHVTAMTYFPEVTY